MGYVNNKNIIKYRGAFGRQIGPSMSWSLNYYLKTFAVGANYFFFIILSVFFLLSSRKNSPMEYRIKNAIFRVFSPNILIMRGINGALETLGNIYYYVINTRAEINKLKSDNFNLRRRLMGFDYIKKENGELKQIVNMVADENISEYKTTRLNILDISPYSNRVSINYGLADELSEGNFILDVEGNLIGRVINVQKNRSEALLITDPRSKIIAQSEKSKINLILSGNGEKMLNIEYIDGEEYNFKNGERIFVSTEKDGRNNFDVGVLVKAKSGTTVKISSNFNKINYGIILLGISDK